MATISSIRTKLLEQFPEPQATLMATVFVESHDELIHRAEFNELTAVVKELAAAQHELAEAQQRTEARVEELADAQKRTEARVEELAEAQNRTEARVEELAEAQKQTTWAVKDLAKQVGGLAGALGGSLEDFACELVPELLEHHRGMVIESAGPEEMVVGGEAKEFDVVIRGSIGGRPVVVLCEVKAAVSASEVRRFLKVVEAARESAPGAEIRAMFFGFRADSQARKAITSAGAAMVFTRGVMIP
jgi:multidrug efflux pump subunit AcrA (membrane-fusion protein)